LAPARRHCAVAQDRQVEASTIEAYQDSTFAEVVLRQVADKAALRNTSFGS
jgi:hypothetical protein